jgi:hypothetical protein
VDGNLQQVLQSSPTHFFHILVTFSSPCAFFFSFPTHEAFLAILIYLTYFAWQHINRFLADILSKFLCLITPKLIERQCGGHNAVNNLHYDTEFTVYCMWLQTVMAKRWDLTSTANINARISECSFSCRRQQSALKNQDRDSSVSTLNRLREIRFRLPARAGTFSTANRPVWGHT